MGRYKYCTSKKDRKFREQQYQKLISPKTQDSSCVQIHEVPKHTTYADGVYVDVSGKSRIRITVGVVLIRSQQVLARFSFPASEENSTSHAEREAIKFAKSLWPDELVYCDCQWACEQENAVYINRRFNGLAHRTAKARINYHASSAINHQTISLWQKRDGTGDRCLGD